jgi:hypothetical protein
MSRTPREAMIFQKHKDDEDATLVKEHGDGFDPLQPRNLYKGALGGRIRV